MNEMLLSKKNYANETEHYVAYLISINLFALTNFCKTVRRVQEKFYMLARLLIWARKVSDVYGTTAVQKTSASHITSRKNTAVAKERRTVLMNERIQFLAWLFHLDFSEGA